MPGDTALVRLAREEPWPIDAIDRQIILATQSGLPLAERPFHVLAERLGMAVSELMARLQAMQAAGIIRRIAAVPNHYALGFRSNGMSVWNISDNRVSECGRQVGGLDFVSHCYHRPRHPPLWPYNLFAMVHGRNRADVEAGVGLIAGLLGADCRGHEVLYSTRILKKTGLRIRDNGGATPAPPAGKAQRKDSG
ncbi:MAG: AsnC family transcriptional regulator [Gammaproteobacteria bacterium]|jgi:DNA-binding Lrp family transcriptional regulator